MQLTEKGKQLILESVKHWNKDIVGRLEKGETISQRGRGLIWDSTGEGVECFARHCPLCEEYYSVNVDSDEFCEWCPYKQYYNVECDIDYWFRFRNEPTLYNAYLMVGSLMAIIHSHQGEVTLSK